jgi:hypothetical protein
MDNQDLFKTILDVFHLKGWTELRVTTHEDYIMHTFDRSDPSVKPRIMAARAAIKEKGWATPKSLGCVESQFVADPPKSEQIFERFVRLIYRPKSGNISLNEMQLGFGFSYSKQRHYPICKSIPKLSLTEKGLWFFNLSRKPRVLMGGMASVWGPVEDHVDWMARVVMGIDYEWKYFKNSWKNFLGTRDKYEMLERVHGARIPKALRYLTDRDLERLVRVIKPNDMNRLCQALIAVPKEIESPTLERIMAQVYATAESTPPYYIINDWIDDHVVLGQKMNLKISSVKRIMDTHRRMSYARALKNTKFVKPHEKYRNVLAEIDPEVSVEFIRGKDRLLDETVKMSHCVATYADRINTGKSAIFHLEYQGIPYTLEICHKEQVLNLQPQSFTRNQLWGYGNSDCPKELIDRVDAALSIHNAGLPMIDPSKVKPPKPQKKVEQLDYELEF